MGEHPAGVGVAQEVTWHIQSQKHTMGMRRTFRHSSCSKHSVISRGETSKGRLRRRIFSLTDGVK